MEINLIKQKQTLKDFIDNAVKICKENEQYSVCIFYKYKYESEKLLKCIMKQKNNFRHISNYNDAINIDFYNNSQIKCFNSKYGKIFMWANYAGVFSSCMEQDIIDNCVYQTICHYGGVENQIIEIVED